MFSLEMTKRKCCGGIRAGWFDDHCDRSHDCRIFPDEYGYVGW